MEKRCGNQFCKKILDIKNGKKRLNPRRKYCDQVCRARENSLRTHYENKENKEFLQKKRNQFKDWYRRNKEIHKKNCLKDYHRNKIKWRERHFVDKHKIKIWEIIGNVCKDCGKEAKEVNHLTYDFPKRNMSLRGEQHIEYLKWYCKHLEPLCVLCHRGRKTGRYKPL